jgi:hypothetical protein
LMYVVLVTSVSATGCRTMVRVRVSIHEENVGSICPFVFRGLLDRYGFRTTMMVWAGITILTSIFSTSTVSTPPLSRRTLSEGCVHSIPVNRRGRDSIPAPMHVTLGIREIGGHVSLVNATVGRRSDQAGCRNCDST